MTAALLGAARAQQSAPTSPEPASPAQINTSQTDTTQTDTAQTSTAQSGPVQTPTPPATSLSQFFAPLQSYPGLVQAQLAVQAAQTQQDSAAFPFSASASGNLVDLANVDPAPAICATSTLALLTNPCAPIGGVTSTLNLTVRATPLPVGDTAARQQQAALATEQARLGYASALSALEGQAVLAAQRVQLSQTAVGLAGQAQAAAQLALQATQNRVAGGGATDVDLAQAQLMLGQAQSGVQQAQDNLALARAALQDLIGRGDAPGLPAVTLPASGTPASVRQAQFGVRRAQIVQAQVSWDALPNVQANYTHYTSDTAGMGLSLDSRNLSPAVNFSYTPRTPPLDRVRDQFSLGVNFDASASSLSAPGLAQNAVAQAQAGLETARRQAELQLAGLNAAYTQAQRQRTLAQQALALAQQQQQNAAARQQIGLSAPLEVAQASAAAYQAQLALGQAQLNETDATLKFYAFFALPLDGSATP
ncbi:TolC family protein [Deinococcus rubellus]|uniref:TolC family protein n=1 Tax=Deinococcus rubellus TaxID=1889240 RepID=UPI0031E6AABB